MQWCPTEEREYLPGRCHKLLGFSPYPGKKGLLWDSFLAPCRSGTAEASLRRRRAPSGSHRLGTRSSSLYTIARL